MRAVEAVGQLSRMVALEKIGADHNLAYVVGTRRNLKLPYAVAAGLFTAGVELQDAAQRSGAGCAGL